MNYPVVTIVNKLDKPLLVYDSFQEDENNKSIENYFGTQSKVGEISANGSIDIQPIHGLISTYIIYDTDNNPIKRVFTLGLAAASFTVEQTDEAIMELTEQFTDLLEKSPNDATAQAFQKVIEGGKATADDINNFFKASEKYQTCSYISYMLRVTTIARTPVTHPKPIEHKTYKLSTIFKHKGVKWPNGLPDIIISDFKSTNVNDQIHLTGTTDIKGITFADGVLDNILTFLPTTEITFSILFNFQAGLTLGYTALVFHLKNIHIPIGGGKKMRIDNPTISLTILPLFKFVVFKLSSVIPFKLFNSPKIDAKIGMTIDNVEAEIGVEFDGTKAPLFTPPTLRGVHFDSIGVGMGLFFKPPNYALGLTGKFHIGKNKNNIISLDDDTFAIVCAMEGDIPNPLYVSFYVPKMDLEEVVTIFTNKSITIDFPVHFLDLSFKWCENLMEPVTLPDGSLAPMGYGFSGFMNLFGLKFYGDIEIDLNHGIQGELTMSKINFGSILKLKGQGEKVTIKIDENGNPIRNNFIPRTAEEKKAVENAKTKTLVKAGGPEMIISTSKSPFFKMDAEIEFLGLKEAIHATIDKKGISFELDFSGIISSKMKCVLQNYHNFSADFSFGPDFNIRLPKIAGVSLGHIHLTATIHAGMGIKTSASEIDFSIKGGFNFEGIKKHFGPFTLPVNISKVSQIITHIEQEIEKEAGKIFSDLANSAEKWAESAVKDIVKGFKSAGHVLKHAFGKSIKEASHIMHKAGFDMNDTAADLKIVFGASSPALAGALAFGFGANHTAITKSLKTLGFGSTAIADGLKVGLGLGPSAVKSLMKGIGISDKDIGNAFKSLGGSFAKAGKSILHGLESVGKHLDPRHW